VPDDRLRQHAQVSELMSIIPGVVRLPECNDVKHVEPSRLEYLLTNFAQQSPRLSLVELSGSMGARIAEGSALCITTARAHPSSAACPRGLSAQSRPASRADRPSPANRRRSAATELRAGRHSQVIQIGEITRDDGSIPPPVPIFMRPRRYRCATSAIPRSPAAGLELTRMPQRLVWSGDRSFIVNR